MTALDTFSETSLMSITRKGGTDREFSCLIETFDVSGGEKGFESVPMISGGRRKRFMPEEDTEITIEGYATEIGTDTGDLGKGFFDLKYGEDSDDLQPMLVSSNHNHDEFQVVILNTDNTSITAATEVTVDGDKALRMIFKNGHFTNVESSFSDNVLKFSITFKVPAFDALNVSNLIFESTDGETAKILTAVPVYT